MLVRFCVVGVIHCLFSFSYGNASFGYYINQHRMCQKQLTVLQRKYVKCQNLFSPTAKNRHGSVTQKVYVPASSTGFPKAKWGLGNSRASLPSSPLYLIINSKIPQ